MKCHRLKQGCLDKNCYLQQKQQLLLGVTKYGYLKLSLWLLHL